MGEKYVTDSYITAVGRIFWGYFFIYINVNIGPVDLLPDWAGYLFLLMALPGIAELEPSALLLRPFACFLLAWDVADVLLGFMGGTELLARLYGLTAAVTVMSLYFHFQLLTNLAQIAARQGNSRDSTFLRIRTCMTVILTAVSLMELLERAILESLVIKYIALGMGCIALVLVIVLLFHLSGYKKELIQMNETWIDSPLP